MRSTAEDQARYREHPIWKTDFSQPVSTIVESLRNDITYVRGKIHDLKQGTGWGERLEHVAGLLTCGLVALAEANRDIIKHEIRMLDEQRGQSYGFSSRGIGMEHGKCLVCGTNIREKNTNFSCLHNISAFVESKEEGTIIQQWAPNSFLDYRPSEPNHIQLKVYACSEHLPNLQILDKTVSLHGRIRKMDVDEAVAFVDLKIMEPQ